MTKRFAFTLAEILISLTIVGVISALTVPNLMNNYQKRTQAVQLRKFANEFYQAIEMMTLDEGKSKLEGTSIVTNLDKDGSEINGVDNFVNNYFRVTKTCESNEAGCFSSQNYVSIDNSQSSAFECMNDSNTYLLSNSSAICVIMAKNPKPKPGVNIHLDQGRPYLAVYVDTNGPEPPNRGGRDMFVFYVNKNNEIVTDNPSSFVSKPEGSYVDICKKSEIGAYCYGALFDNNWNMDY